MNTTHLNPNSTLKSFDRILQKRLQPEAWEWLRGIAENTISINAFQIAFTAIPRHTGKQVFSIVDEEIQEIREQMPGFNIENYTIDRLARVWLLQHFPADDKVPYLKAIRQLFKAAEMNELVALYGALPLLSYPEEWVSQCVEGIRSNIGVVLEAIMCDNPYPAKYLDQAAWNQLVLKAFFTEKPVKRIIGLDERANKELAYILSDYAHERWAAGRTVNPQLWRLMVNFVDDRILKDIEKVFAEGNTIERTAAALVCHQSESAAAKLLLAKHPDLNGAIEKEKISWNSIS